LTPEMFIRTLRITELDLEGMDNTFLKEIQINKHNLDDIASRGLTDSKSHWTKSDDLIWYKDKIYVPRNMELRERILRSRHDTPIASHPGFWKMHDLVERDFWWPSVQSDIRKYIAECDICQRVKINSTKKAAPLNP